jgi:hypothetical protein
MIICKICNAEFKTNAGGDLTKHLMNEHELTMKDYIVLTEYDGNAPICECGFCNDEPEFYRGKFKQYAKNHTSALWYQDNYIKIHGNPTCEECGKIVEFRKGRKVFPRFCSTVCSGTHNKDVIIEKMQPKIAELHADPEYRKKVSISMRKRFLDPSYRAAHIDRTTQWNQSEQARCIKSINSRKMWSDETFRANQSKLIKKATNKPNEKKRRSKQQKANWRDPELRPKYINALLSVSKKFSKTHLRITDQLNLRDLGFLGEQTVNRYSIDELHIEKKIAVEINGDYVHANPKYYAADDIIRLPGSSYTAAEKWDNDEQRRIKLEQMGYTVFVIWESDDIEVIREKLDKLLI